MRARRVSRSYASPPRLLSCSSRNDLCWFLSTTIDIDPVQVPNPVSAIEVTPEVGASGSALTVRRKVIICAGDAAAPWPLDSMSGGAPSGRTFLDAPCVIRGIGRSPAYGSLPIAGGLLLVDNRGDSSSFATAQPFDVLLVGLTFAQGVAVYMGGAIATPDCWCSRDDRSGTCARDGLAPQSPRLNLTAQFCTFEGNTARSGGAVHVGCTTDFIAEHCTFSANTASGASALDGGGALYVLGGGTRNVFTDYKDNRATATLRFSSFTSNRAMMYLLGGYVRPLGSMQGPVLTRSHRRAGRCRLPGVVHESAGGVVRVDRQRRKRCAPGCIG